MGSIIYYFSGTGNSLAIARKISKELGGCAIKSMAAQLPGESVGGPGESIGFVFPVFYNGLPRLVKQFVEKLDLLPETYCFALVNSGGSRANPLGMLADVLQEKGLGLSYADEVTMPGNYIVNYPAFAPDKVRELLESAARRVEMAAKAIAVGERRPVKRKAGLWSELTNRSYLYHNIAEWDEKFITTGRCTGCGVCGEVCPVGNIKIENQHPVWQHSCERCLACLQWCPSEAIEYATKTIGRRRYRNPNIKVEDIIKGHNQAGQQIPQQS